MANERYTGNLPERFESKIAYCPITGCWLWLGYIAPTGYGRISIGGKGFQAHRIIYEAVKGPIPHGLCIDHLCRNRGCVNPDHLEAVTHQVNLVRGFGPTGTNARKQVCVNGHPFTPENTGVTYRNNRRCKQCDRDQHAKRRRQDPSLCERLKEKCRVWWAKNRAKGATNE